MHSGHKTKIQNSWIGTSRAFMFANQSLTKIGFCFVISLLCPACETLAADVIMVWLTSVLQCLNSKGEKTKNAFCSWMRVYALHQWHAEVWTLHQRSYNYLLWWPLEAEVTLSTIVDQLAKLVLWSVSHVMCVGTMHS